MPPRPSGPNQPAGWTPDWNPTRKPRPVQPRSAPPGGRGRPYHWGLTQRALKTTGIKYKDLLCAGNSWRWVWHRICIWSFCFSHSTHVIISHLHPYNGCQAFKIILLHTYIEYLCYCKVLLRFLILKEWGISLYHFFLILTFKSRCLYVCCVCHIRLLFGIFPSSFPATDKSELKQLRLFFYSYAVLYLLCPYAPDSVASVD